MKSYQKIPGIHKPEAHDVFSGKIIVEEKVDGSQFRIQIDDMGAVSCASHHEELSMEDSNFKLGTDQAKKVFKGFRADPNTIVTVFAEYLAKPRQNKLPYARTPNYNFIIFDVMINDKYLDREEKERFAFSVNLEVVPMLWRGDGGMFTKEVREKLLSTPSILGHQKGYDKIEGIVIKNYERNHEVNEGHSLYGHFLCTKIVNEDFKETQKIKLTDNMKLDELKESFRTEARWQKALQHLSDKGELIGEMKDIGLLTREVMTDLEEEEKDTIKDALYKLYGKDILKSSVQGLASWYQKVLEENGVNRE